MNLSCPACGHTARSYAAEAYHRHNFPALCKRNKRFIAWEKARAAEKTVQP
ncbi:hypothetical protein [Novosphingobium sp. FSW06-99]|uniref:hypothetical protein n=1 Tax=Novosphingobium sp. FSW06-99 TaxID=1739113 RepID=UPI000A6DB193|nr:hypothetical protein [Novosphingobium sp. FSW06-99]